MTGDRLKCEPALDENDKPICRLHRKPLEQLSAIEMSSVPGPEDSSFWRCPISGTQFMRNSNFPWMAA